MVIRQHDIPENPVFMRGKDSPEDKNKTRIFRYKVLFFYVDGLDLFALHRINYFALRHSILDLALLL